MEGTMGSMLKPVRFSHFSRTALIGALAALSLIVETAVPLAQTLGSASATYLVCFRSTPVGNEQVGVEKRPDGWSISSSGRVGAPFDLITRSLRARYDADWKPVELSLDATLRGQAATVH